ncbi:MAG: endolytic transglycosylase MltG, partial [Acidobacteriota bacterium]
MSVGAKIFGAILCLMLLVAGVVWVAALRFGLFAASPAGEGREERVVMISPGLRADSIARLLKERGVISDARSFYLLCRLLGLGERLKAGEYAFSPLATPRQILDQIVEGHVLFHRVTIPEGSTVRDVAAIL